MSIRVFSLYLPQYYPTKTNNKYWGSGFTEWANVGRAKKLYPGHYQPKIPKDLGYYDLRLNENRQLQIELAKEAGIDSFCYYHYWFGKGRVELDLPFKRLLDSPDLDFPFCLAWANESWHQKFWSSHGVDQKKLLIEQQYGDNKEIEAHFYYVLKAFKDRRYSKINGRPVFWIFRPNRLPDIRMFIDIWQKLAKQNGVPDIYFIAHSENADKEYSSLMKHGFDAVNSLRMRSAFGQPSFFQKVIRNVVSIPRIESYEKTSKHFLTKFDERNDVYPTIIPNWDHTPRSGAGGLVLHGSTPEVFENHALSVFKRVVAKPEEHRIVFLKSWNEWGEGNYIEPDFKFGRGYIKALYNAKSKVLSLK